MIIQIKATIDGKGKLVTLDIPPVDNDAAREAFQEFIDGFVEDSMELVGTVGVNVRDIYEDKE